MLVATIQLTATDVAPEEDILKFLEKYFVLDQLKMWLSHRLVALAPFITITLTPVGKEVMPTGTKDEQID